MQIEDLSQDNAAEQEDNEQVVHEPSDADNDQNEEQQQPTVGEERQSRYNLRQDVRRPKKFDDYEHDLDIGLLALDHQDGEPNTCENKTIQPYSYNGPNGPSHWKQQYRTGSRQSPINISLCNAVTVPVESGAHILFSEQYNLIPKEMCIYNDGNSVTLYANFGNGSRPEVSGGPCDESYEFLNACFRWGPNDYEGSEHTVDCGSYAMELQAIHVKGGRTYCTLNQAVEDNALLIISYLYQISPVDNPYINHLTSTLPRISALHKCCQMEPVPLSFFMPPFVSKYVSYCGSLTFPPCTEGVRWIVQTEPLGISITQVR
ncbi:hypothetical protein RI129_001514 [Pyrocoelia pectoralis]|uniref:Alpha-carbonic anhydrase domain-containing protein n=1 Tax=Pyrocoelia pectoralis TaxID=417401 RepID=A0AAN7VJQ2_9COLE